MFEARTKENRRYYIEIGDERIPFRTQTLAVFAGRAAVKDGCDSVRLIEEYDLFSRSGGKGWQHIDHQEFDRTSLIKNYDI